MPTWAESEMLERLRRLEAGEVESLGGCRAVVELLSSLHPDLARSPAARVFAGVCSETESFPVGSARDAWEPVALARADAEAAAYLAEVRGALEDACRELSALISAHGASC